MTESFWKGKSVFLTGHNGFKGSWLAMWLHQLGAKVSGYSLAQPDHLGVFNAVRLTDRVVSTIGDVRDLEGLRRAMMAAEPEVVFHLAAQPLVRQSYVSPVETYEVNVMGTVNFLESIRSTLSVRAAVIVTSDKCYHNREWEWGYRETDPLGGIDPYSSSKGGAELISLAYRHSFFAGQGIGVASVRAGNVIGGGDWAADRLIPDMVRAWSEKENLYVRYPHAVRPWQHVLEPLRGYLMVAEKLCTNSEDYGEAWNFGPRDEDAWSVENVVREGAEVWGEGAEWQMDDGKHPHEARYLKLDCSKARTKLGWSPVCSLNTALEWTISWYRAQIKSDVDMYRFSVEQISMYEALVAASAAKTEREGVA